MGAISIFKRRPRPGLPLAFDGLADGLNKMATAWEGLEVIGGVLDWINGRPRIIVGGGIGGMSFFTTVSGDICTVRAGYIRFDGVGEVEIPETQITLTNTPNTWVFAWCNFADVSTAGIDQSATRAGTMPEGSVFRQPLAHFTASTPGRYVFAAPGRCHIGDIVRGSPMLGVPA